MPTNDWFAIYEVSDDDDIKNVQTMWSRLIGWALVQEEDNRQFIVGIELMDDSSTRLVDLNTDRFVMFIHKDDDPKAMNLDIEARITKEIYIENKQGSTLP